MHYSPLLLSTYSLIICAILSVWHQPNLGKTAAVPNAVTMGALLLAVVFGILGGYVTPAGACGLALFVSVAFFATRPNASRNKKIVLVSITVLLALLLAMHLLPGFNNPRVLDKVKLTQDAIPFTLYANFDKAAVGLVLLAFFCKRTTSWAEFLSFLKKSVPLIFMTVVSVLGAALALGVVRLEIKVPESILSFVVINLFFTCVAEEAFFRGLLQEKLSGFTAHKRHGEKIAIAASGLLFGAVHLGGGVAYMALATIAGVGYACIYSATKRIEYPIVAHFLFNIIHFIGFTYPALA